MHIVRNGIDVPDELVRAHEEGKVVFFCGAGISYESNLPNVEDLTKTIFSKVGERFNAAEKGAATYKRWDAVLGSLENRIADRSQVRRKLREALIPDASKANSVATHEAILELATTKGENARLQLVTTNFDRLFESLIDSEWSWAQKYSAPLLPTPRKGLWNGIVYLHGLLLERYDSVSLANLVVTSGDYGRAYLSEAWAARFVAELLRNYVVCFVGYSLGDQTVRYLMDAVDVYNRIGDKTEKVYMFTDSSEPDVMDQNKCLVRIVYDGNANGGKHAILHQTLQAWAKRYKAGIDGKYELIREFAKINPADIPDDGYVDQMLWALSDDDGNSRALRYFVSLEKCPNFGWLDIFEKRGFLDDTIFSRNENDGRGVLLGCWLLRMMQYSEVVLWVIKNQQKIIPPFFEMVKNRCNRGVVQNGNDELRLDAFSKRLWRLVVAKKIGAKNGRNLLAGLEVEHWIADGAMDCLKLERLYEILKPTMKISASYGIFKKDKDGLAAGALRETIRSEIGYDGCEEEYLIKTVWEKLNGRLLEIVFTASDALEEALDEWSYLHGGVIEEIKLAMDIPSIEDHWQNTGGMRSMPHLAAIIRDGWSELLAKDRERAQRLALHWLHSKHLTMKRFGLYAAKVADVVAADVWVGALTEWCGYILWSSTVKREVMRLIFEKASSLTCAQIETLTDAIVKGFPPCKVMTLAQRSDDAAGIMDHAKFVRLAKLKSAVGTLPAKGENEISRIHIKHPEWVVAEDESDEFVSWGTWTGDPTEELRRHNIEVPRNVGLLTTWLREDSARDWFVKRYERDDFEKVCVENRDAVIRAFDNLADAGVWNIGRMSAALDEWTSSEAVQDAAAFLLRVFPKMPKETFGFVVNKVASWCEDVVKRSTITSEDLLSVGRMVLDADYERDRKDLRFGEKDDLVSIAINHPVGRMVAVLLEKCFPSTIHKDEGIAETFRTLFEVVAQSLQESAVNGRLILASRAIALYYADEEWTRKYILPHSSWKNENEAAAFWQGFLWQRSMHLPLLRDIKAEFLDTLNHYDRLSSSGHSYISLFVSLALLGRDDFSDSEIENVIRRMTSPQLEDAARVIEDHMNHVRKSGGDVDGVWRERCMPIVRDMWPKDYDKLTAVIQDRLSLALLNTDNVLADGLSEMWFIRTRLCSENRDCSWFLSRCSENENLERHPEACLEILNNRITTVPMWEADNLGKCLERLKGADGEIVRDPRYIRLRQMCNDAKEALR